MIENDQRKEHHGFKVGQRVVFRYSGMKFRGIIKRLTAHKALIAAKMLRVSDTIHYHYIAYRQIERKRQ